MHATYSQQKVHTSYACFIAYIQKRYTLPIPKNKSTCNPHPPKPGPISLVCPDFVPQFVGFLVPCQVLTVLCVQVSYFLCEQAAFTPMACHICGANTPTYGRLCVCMENIFFSRLTTLRQAIKILTEGFELACCICKTDH